MDYGYVCYDRVIIPAEYIRTYMYICRKMENLRFFGRVILLIYV